MKIIEGGVTAPKGFMASSVAAGIKYENREDMAMVYSEAPCTSYGVYTSNIVKAAPVVFDKKVTDSDTGVRAIVVNAGIANACTGKKGMEYCEMEALAVAESLMLSPKSVVLCSTGVIGKQLPMDKIVAGIKKMSHSLKEGIEAGTKASKAIMTTDTVNKEVAVSFEVGGKTVTMGGMSKGSGMIHPDMCTMLGFVTTDCAISKEMLKKALTTDVKDTFNMISVDGDTSTNDSLIVLANGTAGNKIIDSEGEDFNKFLTALHYINETLAKKMAADGEGATALLEVKVFGALTKEQAKILAKSVACSSLVKAAVYGHDANWGRIMCALGYSGADFKPEEVTIQYESEFGKILVCEKGSDVDFSEEEATKILSSEAVTFLIDLNMGSESATAWGCDLTHEYVSINADYRS
ncbi:MAG: bifunctional glutamate N-acetyltransferase/amino-acid acetyltransferase ArgJ [Lachnospiraceae bacterium]|nr:bifunctional glutamate N-acetyltransferase/amino-acid acetyltransferase ArgJ [Lachnospiraceae bacterium]